MVKLKSLKKNNTWIVVDRQKTISKRSGCYKQNICPTERYIPKSSPARKRAYAMPRQWLRRDLLSSVQNELHTIFKNLSYGTRIGCSSVLIQQRLLKWRYRRREHPPEFQEILTAKEKKIYIWPRECLQVEKGYIWPKDEWTKMVQNAGKETQRFES